MKISNWKLVFILLSLLSISSIASLLLRGHLIWWAFNQGIWIAFLIVSVLCILNAATNY